MLTQELVTELLIELSQMLVVLNGIGIRMSVLDAVTSGTIIMEPVPQFFLSVKHAMKLMVTVLHVSQVIIWLMLHFVVYVEME
mgnify:CR=1 FL=1